MLFLALLLLPSMAYSQKNKNKAPTRFYNFDDLLINGQVVKPKVQYIDSRQKVKFGKLLKLKKNMLNKLKSTSKDASLR